MNLSKNVLSQTSEDTLSFLWDLKKDTLTLSPSLKALLSLSTVPAVDVRYFLSCHIHSMDIERIRKQFNEALASKQQTLSLRFEISMEERPSMWVEMEGFFVFDSAQSKAIACKGTLICLETQAAIDRVTGIYMQEIGKNRFEDYVFSGNDHYGTLMILGIDEFTNLNSLHTNNFGDWVLRTFTQELYAMLPENMQLYRYEGDQIILFGNEMHRAEMETFYNLIKNDINNNILFIKWIHNFTISAGIVQFPKNGISWQDMLKCMEIALNKAKESGKNRCITYQKEMLTRQMHEQFINQIIADGVDNNCHGFRVVYQPICDTRTLNILGAEALLRFDAPNGQTMRPDTFIPFLEKSRLIIPVGTWVLEQAIGMCKTWIQTNKDFKISVNLSYIQLRDPGFSNIVKQLLAKYELDSAHLVLELTESYFISDASVSKVLDDLRGMQIQLAMDDFGTGYSSLARLAELRVDIVKIDKLFVQSIQTSAYTQDFIGAVVRLCHNVGLKVCVEGVETRLEQKHISLLRADYIQGYYVSRPMDADEFDKAYIQQQVDTSLLAVPLDQAFRRKQLSGDANFLQVLIDSMPLALIIWDHESNIISCNKEALHLYGIDNENNLSKNFYNLSPLHQQDGQLSTEKVTKKIAEAVLLGSTRFEWQHLDVKGNMIPCEVICTRVEYHDTYIVVSYTRDIREQIALEEQTRKLNHRIHAILDAMPLCANLWNKDMQNIMCNKEAVKLFDLENEQQYITYFFDLSPEFQPDGTRSSDKAAAMILEAFDKGYIKFQWMHCKLNKEAIPCEITLVRIEGIGDNGENLVAGYTRDIREQLRVAEIEKKANQRMEKILNGTPLACLLWTFEGYCIDCNQAAFKLFGITEKEDLIYHFDEFFPLYQPDGARSDTKKEELMERVKHVGEISFEWVYLNKNHENVPCEVTLVSLSSQEEEIIVAYSRDLRELKKTLEINARLSQLAYYDLLTGCSSRSAFMESAQIILDARVDEHVALLMFDIDHFKSTNDTYGHEAGDITLKYVVSKVREILPENALLGRYGGDEFLIIIPHIEKEELLLIMQQIKEKLNNEPIVYGSNFIHAMVSIGATFSKASDRVIKTLIKRSDRALYKAKEAGRNRSVLDA